MRDVAIKLRALPEQRNLIDEAAGRLGKTRSDFMLEAACDKARSVLLDRALFQLDEAKYARFLALFDAPLDAYAGLERLRAIKAPWDAGA